MYKLFVIAKNNIKKQKGDMITFCIITAIVTLLLYISVSVLTGIGKIYQNRFDEINGAHFIATVFDNEASVRSLRKAFEENGITDYEETEILDFDARYKNKKDKDYQTYEFLVESSSANPEIMDVFPKDRVLSDNEVLIPYHIKGKFDVGDILQIELGSKIHELRVAGYSENPWFCSTLSFGVYYIYVNENTYKSLANENTGTIQSPVYKNILFKGVLSDEKPENADMDQIELNINESFERLINKEEKTESPEMYKIYNNANWNLIKWGNGMLPNIVASIILVFAIILLTISLIVISFSIKNFIHRNIKNTGILEASGYTVKELRAALIFQIMIISLTGIIAGIIVGIITGTKVSELFSLMLGLTFKQNIDIAAAFAVGISLLLVNFITVGMLSHKYKKITVLDALRGGINAHNFKKNYFPFEKTGLPIPVTLSLKDTFGSFGKNTALVVIVAFLALTCITGFGLVENFSSNPEGLLNIMGVDFGNLEVSGESGHAEELRKVEGVENVLTEVTMEPVLEFNGVSGKYFTTAHEDEKYSKKLVVVEGRYAREANEVMITGAVADEIGAKIGDVVTIKVGGKSADYIITGFNQRLMSAGKNLSMTIDGAKRLGVDTSYCDYYITAKDGVSFDELKKNVEDYAQKQNILFSYMDTSNVIDSTVGSVESAMTGACILFVVITVLIVVFVESLVIRAKITREWKDMGISKAIGMRSGDLLIQIAMSNIPSVVVGCIIGVLLSGQAGKTAVKGAFSYMGIRKVEFNQSFLPMLMVAVGITAVALITSYLAGRKVKKLVPVEMITEE